MSNDELNNALFDKMQAEQDSYRNWLLSQPPEEILRHSYEFTVRADILMTLENNNLSDEQASALLKSKSPLADVFKDFTKVETGYMDTIRDTLESRADKELQKEIERSEALRSLPVYLNSATYARDHKEIEQYRASYKANVACKEAIEKAINDNYHYEEYTLDTKTAIKQVVDTFGYDRTLYVLANTIRHKDWDGRISPDNKRWAATQNVAEDKDSYGSDRNVYFVVDQAHTGLMDIFATHARREFLLTQPLDVAEIREEAQRLLDRLKAPTEPNSPNKTHYMAQISKDFLARAGSKDLEVLQKFFPFKSLALTTMKDRKGVFAVISGDENRDKKLREPRLSVMAKLEKPLSATSPNNSAKSHDAEL